MVRYETLFLTVPEITKDEAAALESQIDKIVQNANFTILSFDRWGKYLLAYPVKKNDYGIYFLFRFEGEDTKRTELFDNLTNLFALKFGDIVMRSMTTRLPLKQSLEYNRPESLEETPVKDIDTFLKENKMEGLLSSGTSGKSAATQNVVKEIDTQQEQQEIEQVSPAEQEISQDDVDKEGN